MAYKRMDLAIKAAAADKEYERSLLMKWYDSAKADLDKADQRAWELYLTKFKDQINDENERMKTVGDIMLALAQEGRTANISLSDSLDVAIKKAAPIFAQINAAKKAGTGRTGKMSDEFKAWYYNTFGMPANPNDQRVIDEWERWQQTGAGLRLKTENPEAKIEKIQKLATQLLEKYSAGKMNWAEMYDTVKINFPDMPPDAINELLGGGIPYNPETGVWDTSKAWGRAIER